jgi:hypothetical protein
LVEKDQSISKSLSYRVEGQVVLPYPSLIFILGQPAVQFTDDSYIMI